jgi:GWxTD domain-containing protein
MSPRHSTRHSPRTSPRAPAALGRLPRAAGIAAAALAVALAAALPAAADYTKEQRKAIAEVPAPYRTWLEAVELIIQDAELEAFLALEQDYQRDAFIKHFWRVRDPYKDTARNEYQEQYEERVAYAKQSYASLQEDRARALLLNGPPHALIEVRCGTYFKPLELWFYAASTQVPFEFSLIFYREGNVYRLWRAFDGVERLMDTLMGDRNRQDPGGLLRRVQMECKDGEAIAAAIARALNEGPHGHEVLMGRVHEKPKLEQSEWVATFASYTTELPPEAPALPAELALSYPGRRQNRTVLQGTVAVPRAAAASVDLAGARSFNFVLIGEVLRDGELFDTFRYKFDLPAEAVNGGPETNGGPATNGVPETNGAAAASDGTAAELAPAAEVVAGEETLPLVFRRFLRPGDYRLVVRLEDLNGGAFFRAERDLAVPEVEGSLPPPEPEDPETARLLAEANAMLSGGGTTLQIVPPARRSRPATCASTRWPPATPSSASPSRSTATRCSPRRGRRSRSSSTSGRCRGRARLAAVAFDGAGEELARDELLINAGGNRFSVDLVEPRRGKTYRESLTVEADVGRRRARRRAGGGLLERDQASPRSTRSRGRSRCWCPPDEIAYLRAVAYLPDGNSTEDLVFVNAPDYLDEVDVQFVELFATVRRPQAGRSRR